MARLNAVTRLPAEVRKEIDTRLIDGGFANYQAFSDELRRRGFAVSKSALHRYGRALEIRLQTAKAAAEIRAAGVDPEIAAELCGDATLVVVVDRAYGRARLVSVPAPAAEVIKQVKRIGAPGAPRVIPAKIALEFKEQRESERERRVAEGAARLKADEELISWADRTHRLALAGEQLQRQSSPPQSDC